jgi:protein TonB
MSAVAIFDRGFFRSQSYARRGAIGAALLAVHLGFIGLFALSSVAPKADQTLPPIEVDFLEQTSKDEPVPDLQPKLVAAVPLEIETPDVPLPTEVEAPAADTVPLATAVAPVAPVTTASSDSRGVPELSDVSYLKPPVPRYPSESRRAREQGLVLLRVLIDESGHVCRVNVYRSSGHPRLDEAARDAVEHALFKPYFEGGVARAAFAVVPIEFSLHT